jgi:hypothetical protein
MVSTAVFWSRVGAYNQATWPISIVMTVVALFLTWRVFFRPGARTDTWLKAFLSLAFAWNGIVFFLIFLRVPLSMLIGAPLFLIVSVLFAVDIRTKKTHFRLPEAMWKRGLTILWIVLVFLQPAFGWPLGHIYPQVLLPMFPCPLTVFAIALMAAAAPRVDKKAFVLLLPWALMALPKCFGALGCYEDCILFASGVYGLVELIRNWKTRQVEAREEAFAQQEASG